MLVAALGSTALWSLAMFGPGTTYLHQGSHVPVLLACVLPVAWLADRRPAELNGRVAWRNRLHVVRFRLWTAVLFQVECHSTGGSDHQSRTAPG